MNEKRLNHIYYTSILAIVLVIAGGIFFCTYVKIRDNRNVDKVYVDDYFKDVFKLLGEHTATWDRYLQANEIEKKIIWAEMDSIRKQLNMKLPKPDVVRDLIQPKTDLFINSNL